MKGDEDEERKHWQSTVMSGTAACEDTIIETNNNNKGTDVKRVL